jgi:hypothetical protein
VPARSPFLARITAVKELHGRGSDRSCVHVEVDVSGSDIAYEAGKHLVCSKARIEQGSAPVAGIGTLLPSEEPCVKYVRELACGYLAWLG